MLLKTVIPLLRFNYGLSEDGVLRNLDTGKTLKPCMSVRGYACYGLYKTGAVTYATYTRAQLLALAFIPNPERKPQVDHIDGVKTNDALSNLRWSTMEENLQLDSSRSGQRMMPMSDVLTYRQRHMRGETWKSIAKSAGYEGRVRSFSMTVQCRKV